MKKMACDYDAIVIGGGPAGSVAAGFLAKGGMRVALFEKEKFPRYHIGESLLPATTLGVLAKLGIKERIDNYGFPKKLGGTFRWGKQPEPWTFRFYRTDEERRAGEDSEYLHSYQVRRAEFDQLLLDHARSLGAEVYEESALAALEGHDEPVKTAVVDLKGKGRRKFQAPFIVDAGGRNSLCRRLFGERHYDPFFKNIAVFGYFTGGKRLPGDRKGNIFCEAFPNGWFWYIPLNDQLTSVGVVIGKERYHELKPEAPQEFHARMIGETKHVREFLESATPCREAPYDCFRVETDFSYAHSEFVRNGVFLAGDAACFIDPVFSSGVHLATYSGYLAAQAIARVRSGKSGLAEESAEFESLYRQEYLAFYRFLVSFYEMHKDPGSYFWAARKVVGREHGSDFDSFISIVTGTSTTGGRLFDSVVSLAENISLGRRSLETLVQKVSGERVGDRELAEAVDFMKPIQESRKRFLEDPAQK